MSNRLAQYKKPRAVQSRKATVKEEKAVEVKSKRNERFMNRRALSEVTVQSQDEDTVKRKQPKRTIKTTRLTTARKEELLKWKEKREVQKVKERENTKKRPPFIVGRFTLGESSLKKHEPLATKVTKPAKVPKPAKGNMSTRSQNKTATLDTLLESTSSTKEGGPSTQTTPERPAISAPHHTHRAWIPGATLPTPKATKSFNELFPTEFSPFKFTNTSDKYLGGDQFTFQKELDDSMEEELIDEEADEMDTSHGKGAETKRGEVRSDDSVEIINHSILHNHEVTNTINELETKQSRSSDEEEVAPEQASEFSCYRQLYDDIIAKFTALCEEWEGKEAELQSSGEASSEVCDQIRITACQARLLMRSKLKQYIGLVVKAEDPSESLPTTAADLQGFWDMMSLQISGLEAKFASLVILEENGWEEMEEKVERKKVTKLRKKRRASRGKPKTPSDRLKSDRAKREEQRRLMKEKIMAAKRNKRKSINASPAVPPTSGSGLTPPPSEAIYSSTTNDKDLVATGNLVSLTPAKTPVKLSKRKSMSLLKTVLTSNTSSSESDCGSVTTLVKIKKPTKKLIRDLGSSSDVIMSPARRSLRIQRKSVGVALQDPMDFIRDLPDNAECVMYKPIESHI